MDGFLLNIIKILTISSLSFLISLFLTPFLTKFLYQKKLWRKNVREKTIDGKEAKIYKILSQKRETSVPRFGGVLIIISPLVLGALFLGLSKIFPENSFLQKLNFFSRNQTWLCFFALTVAGILGFVDDWLQVKNKGSYIAGGLSFWQRFFVVFLIGLIGGLWFGVKLEKTEIKIPGMGKIELPLGAFLFLFIITTLACWAGGVVDGLDGLAGGVFGTIYFSLGVISLFQNQIDLSAFCFAILGSLLTFLWFNIPPARFYMGETGSLPLCVCIAVISFLNDSLAVLPIIAGVMVIEVLSVILQLFWKKFFKKKLFLIAPLHHHFDAKGWPSYKITMRFWILSSVFAILGVLLHFLG